ncbi:RagB/SusD family nutrient uptake outer membrane protein [Flavobacterium ginsenosidimutans]|uniref:RagB/SusD family nutrient uptake outer membrane protein n=1 Tax=Flavobacterium ginsenosidimutans TaxID=687844 RepID=A0ABZ2QG47_9FLAO|nr:RagB/SusD family nutrient uptake outer membrane protein [Flavobacterium ginsenosidimutans]KAF2331838.1 RagB/SusD family nutrient uptake outer membrane protein [Flavobacterium ginsenosidimutans]
MKKYTILLLLLTAGTQFSCNQDLDPTVYSSLTNTNGYQTKSDAIASINSIYGRLKGPSVGDNFSYWATRHFALTDIATDLGHCQYGGDPGQLSLGTWNSTNGLLAEDWNAMYKLIANANNAIFNITPMGGITAAEKAQFIAEAKFLRCSAYMDLTDSWGPVILITEANLGNPGYLDQTPPSSVEEIDAFIIKELTEAADVLPVNYESNEIYGTNDVGRATKGAALTLLAKLYMRSHDWQKVVTLTQQVMDLNQYSLYPSYLGLFKESNKWCNENIFSSLSDANTNGTELLNHFGPIDHPVVQNRWQYYTVNWDFYNTFGDEDERKQCFFPEFMGTDGLLHKQAPSLGAEPPEGEFYMPDVSTKKYADDETTTYYDGHSVNILRYADVLLSRAEALNEISGPTSEAIDLINRVKARSHAKLLVLAGQTQETLRDAILQERGWEFFYEGKRRQDLIRMNKYDVLVNAYHLRVGEAALVKMPQNKYYTYPQSQVNLNPKLSNADRQ